MFFTIKWSFEKSENAIFGISDLENLKKRHFKSIYEEIFFRVFLEF